MTALLMVFDDLQQGEAARAALLSDGLPAQALELSTRHDEAGPVEGNFVAGNVKRDTMEATPFAKSHGGVGDNSYQHNHKRVVDRGVCLLTVDAQTDEEWALACSVMQRYGALNVNGAQAQTRPRA